MSTGIKIHLWAVTIWLSVLPVSLSAQNHPTWFKLFEVDTTLKPVDLPRRIAQKISLDSKLQAFYDGGFLKVIVPDPFYHDTKPHLVFIEPEKIYAFWPFESGRFTYTINDTVSPVYLMRRTNPLWQFQNKMTRSASDSLTVTAFVVAARLRAKFPALSSGGGLPADGSSLKTEFTKEFAGDTLLSAFVPLMDHYFDHWTMTTAYAAVWNDYSRASPDVRGTAFFKAKFMADHFDQIQMLSDSIHWLTITTQNNIPDLEQDNLDRLSLFIKAPNAYTSSAGRPINLGLFCATLQDYLIPRIIGGPPSGPRPIDTLETSCCTAFTASDSTNSQVGRPQPGLQHVLQRQFKPGKFPTRTFFPGTWAYLGQSAGMSDLRNLSDSIKKDFNSFPFRVRDWLDTLYPNEPNVYKASYNDLSFIFKTIEDSSTPHPIFNVPASPYNQVNLVNLITSNLRDSSDSAGVITDSLYNDLRSKGNKYFVYLLNAQAPQLFAAFNRLAFAENGVPYSTLPTTADLLATKYNDIAKRFGDILEQIRPALIRIASGDSIHNLKEKADLLNGVYQKAYTTFYYGDQLNRRQQDSLTAFNATVMDLYEGRRVMRMFMKDSALFSMLYHCIETWLDTLRQNKDAAGFLAAVRTLMQIVRLHRELSYLISANTPADISNTLEAIYLPRNVPQEIKLESFSLLAQTFLGPDISRSAVGLTLPIGIALDFGMGKKPDAKKLMESDAATIFNALLNKPHNIIQLFAQFIDPLNPFAVGVGVAKNSILFRKKWSAILDPGIMLGWGFKNLPLTVLGGFDYNYNIKGARSIGWKMSVCLDIPVIRLK